ncbi:hypothetical protein ACZ90_70345 [Streptomyces albus subsp. albus]|nr:hypothetical protein ACZ90_70345 [Streptomyces albus subsp. albus]
MLKRPLRRGYWCECTTHPATRPHPALLASIETDTPQQAMQWIRVIVRTVASALEREAFHDAWDWISGGYHDAQGALTRGEATTFSITHQDTNITWTARPVIFLPLAHREAVRLPACAEQFTCPTTHRLARTPHQDR